MRSAVQVVRWLRRVSSMVAGLASPCRLLLSAPNLPLAAENGLWLVSGRNSLGGDWCVQFWFCYGFAIVLVCKPNVSASDMFMWSIRDTPAHPVRYELRIIRNRALHPARIELATFSVLG